MNQQHRFNAIRINNEYSGEYNSTTYNVADGPKIESDFICEANTIITSMQDTARPTITFEIGTRVGLNGSQITAFRLRGGRGQSFSNGTWQNLNLVHLYVAPPPPVQQQVNNEDMATKKATVRPVVTSAAAPSRSQVVKDPFAELETKITRNKELRLEKFLKKNLPETVKEFLIQFFTVYNRERATIYVDTKAQQTDAGRRRSLGDLFQICRYYYPEVTLKEVVSLLFRDLAANPKLNGGFRFSYCTTVNKRVFYYSAGSGNLREDQVVDEYGHRLPYYMEKI